jgi:hypothetical protein
MIASLVKVAAAGVHVCFCLELLRDYEPCVTTARLPEAAPGVARDLHYFMVFIFFDQGHNFPVENEFRCSRYLPFH